jgi:hypothetical protein
LPQELERTVSFQFNRSTLLDIQQYAREESSDAMLVLIDPAVRLNPVILTVDSPDPILTGVGAASFNRLVDGFNQSSLVVRVNRCNHLLQGKSMPAERWVETERFRKLFIYREAVGCEVP